MSKIPKEIVDKIEQRNKLNEEIETWCKENLDMDGMDPDYADITDHHTGKEQGNDECKEWCEQWSGYEDAEEKDRLGQWIPCSERLPENNTDVIVCFYSGTVTEMRYWGNGIFQGIYEHTTKVIVAWMPLPEPYKGGRVDDERAI